MAEQSKDEWPLSAPLANREWVHARVCHYHYGASIDTVAAILKMDVKEVANVLSGPICDGGWISRLAAFIWAANLASLERYKYLGKKAPPKLRGGALALAVLAQHYRFGPDAPQDESVNADYLLRVARDARIIDRVPSKSEVAMFHAGRLRNVDPEDVIGSVLPPIRKTGEVGLGDSDMEHLALATWCRLIGAGMNRGYYTDVLAGVAVDWLANLVSDEPVPSRWTRSSIQSMLPHYARRTRGPFESEGSNGS